MSLSGLSGLSALFLNTPDVSYLFRDEFVTTRVAGSINGTTGDGTGSTRTSTDTENKLSQANGKLVIAGGKTVPAWGDPALAEDFTITRAVGRCAIWRVTITDTTKQFAVGIKASTGEYWGFKFGASQVLSILANTAPSTTGTQVTIYDFTDYLLCIDLKSSGSWYYIKGGAYAEWTLLYVSLTGATASLFASIESYDAPVSSAYFHAPLQTYAPACLVSDTFDRANGVIGTANGTADADVSASTQAWSNVSGTWNINTNEAAPNGAASPGIVSTVNAGAADYWVRAELKTSGNPVGIALRVVDANNYIFAGISTTLCWLRAVIGGINQAYAIAQTSITYAAGAEIAVRVETISGGTRFTLWYNGVYIGTAVITTAALQSSTLVGLYATSVGSVFKANNLVCWPLLHAGINAIEPDTVSYSVDVYKLDANNLEITIPISGASSSVRAKYQIRKITKTLTGWAFPTNCWHIGGIKIVNGTSGGVDITMTDIGADATTINSAFEFAYKIGTTGDIEANFDFYGSLHSAIKNTAFSMTINGIDISALAVGQRAFGDRIVITQSADIYLPSDKTTVIGATTFSHTIDNTGVLVHHSHTYSAGYQIYQAYSAMLPTDIGGSNQYQIGSNALTNRVQDDGNNFLGTQADTALSKDTRHLYQIAMTLPTGGPDDNGSWAKTGTWGLWYNDRTTATGKAYANWIGSTFATDKQTAVNSAHTARYHVTKN